MGVSAVLLAAGTSSRWALPDPKQLLEVEGEPLVRRMARVAVASTATEVIVVVGHREQDMRAALRGLDVTIVSNPDYREGRSASVHTALEIVASTSNGAMFLPVDQPFLDTPTLDLLIDEFEASGQPIAVPTHDRRRGAPVIFARTLFNELATITGDDGGRQLFTTHRDEILEIALPDPRPLQDIDTLEAWQALSPTLREGETDDR